MPRDVRQFTLVISAPGDLSRDVQEVERAVLALNHALDPRRVIIRTRHWSHSATPGVGAEGQQVVRRQLLEDADILVALIGRRLGTPTRDHESGTADEIKAMRARDGAAFGGHHLQVYFKSEGVPMDQNALDEASRVVRFKNSLREDGVFHGEYTDVAELGQVISSNIQRAIEVYIALEEAIGESIDVVDRLGNNADAQQEKSSPETENDEPGILDRIVNFHVQLNNSTQRFYNFSNEVSSLATFVNEIVARIPADSPDAQQEIINSLADRMRGAATRITQTVEGSEEELENAVRDLIAAVREEISQTASPDTSDAAIAELLEVMQTVVAQIDDLRQSIGETVQFQGLPDLTSRLRNAKRLLSAAFEAFNTFLMNSRESILSGYRDLEIIAQTGREPERGP
jgi:hypothetical protein